MLGFVLVGLLVGFVFVGLLLGFVLVGLGLNGRESIKEREKET